MKILLLTGHFPPEKTGGIGRPYSLYKYLPGDGVDVSVVTKNLYGSLPGEESIYRYDSFGNWRNSPLLSRKVILKMISLIKNKLYGINYDGWWAKKVIQNINDYKSGIDLIYASFPGPEVLQAAIKLKEILQIPLIVEFRDGLAFEPVISSPNFLQWATIKKLEKKAVTSANAIITIGENLSAYFIKKYKRKILTVYNGYEESDFNLVYNNKEKSENKKYIIQFGSLSATKKAKRDGLFNALKNLKNNETINETNFELLFIGNISKHEKKEISKYNLSKIVSFLPLMDKKKGFSFISKEADYLLFYGVPNETTIISSKLLEYIRLNKPIIGICKGNEAEQIIEKTGTGEVCDFDEKSIEALLMKIVNNEVFYNPDYMEIEKFNRKKQAKEIASIIKNVITSEKNKLEN